jgi:NADH-ubiquinone oxidoreductase chain 1
MQCILVIILIIGVLVGVAFFTLFERKLLGYIQLRKGPNKTGFMGILQPFADAIKLFSKEHVVIQYSNYIPFLIAPVVSLSLSLIVWITLPTLFNNLSFDLRVLFFLCCVGLGVYALLCAGWRSNSKYSLFGALRGVAQTISYEVSLVLILLSPAFLTQGYQWLGFVEWQVGAWFFLICPMSCIIWFLSCLAETNRTPFDFAEGESELVSGYNTEYGRGRFALLMLAEYTSILFISFIIQLIFFGGNLDFLGWIIFVIVAFCFVWVRGTLPRFRYDILITLAWMVFLPYSLVYLMLISGIRVFY